MCRRHERSQPFTLEKNRTSGIASHACRKGNLVIKINSFTIHVYLNTPQTGRLASTRRDSSINLRDLE
ncbi:hypothetical protein BCAR13_790067 [Paraburkholderia caribensis]|nr:hypothetical protein BCAR13_790067 [Paraburkholderia caribensis]